MPKLWYFYYSTGDCKTVKFDKSKTTNNKWANQFYTEGQCDLFRELSSQDVIDGCSIVIESGIDSGYKQLFSGMDCYVVPHLSDVLPYINDDDILFMRGGFKSWIPVIEKFVAEDRNLLFYAANTGRARWAYWNIVADDLADCHYTGKNDRLYWHYRKPINQDIFYYDQRFAQEYDLCIGASHIHDKKGQWRVVEMLKYLKQKYDYNIKSVLPGAPRRGVHTNTMLDDIKKYNLNIDVVGMLPREKLADVMRSSKVFFHAGTSGQNDRGPMEAMACGCYVGIHAPQYHAPFIYENKELSFVNSHVEIPAAAEKLHDDMAAWRERPAMSDYYNQENGLDICVKDFKKLFNFLKNNPKRNQKALLEEYKI